MPPRSSNGSYEKLLVAIREEIAPLKTQLEHLENTLDNKYYTKEAVDALLREARVERDGRWAAARAEGEGMLREYRLEMSSMKEALLKQAQSWQVLLTRFAAWASIAYVLFNISQHVIFK